MEEILCIKKPCKCPKCGGKVARILYGMPAYSEKLQADLDAGRIILGGCEMFEHMPTWQCTKCGQVFYQVSASEPVVMKHPISLHTIHAGYKDAALAETLYTSAFPEIEQHPIEELHQCTLKGRCFWYAVLDGTTFIGMAYVVLYRKIAYILYLAVDEKKRNKHYGSDILTMLKEMYRDKKLVLFIESLDEECDNYDMRVRRKAFYLRNGFYDTHLNQDCETDLGHCTYEILSTDPNLSEKEFATFIRHYPMTTSMTVLHKR